MKKIEICRTVTGRDSARGHLALAWPIGQKWPGQPARRGVERARLAWSPSPLALRGGAVAGPTWPRRRPRCVGFSGRSEGGVWGGRRAK
jgi:hypothetical protein